MNHLELLEERLTTRADSLEEASLDLQEYRELRSTWINRPPGTPCYVREDDSKAWIPAQYAYWDEDLGQPKVFSHSYGINIRDLANLEELPEDVLSQEQSPLIGFPQIMANLEEPPVMNWISLEELKRVSVPETKQVLVRYKNIEAETVWETLLGKDFYPGRYPESAQVSLIYLG